MSSNSNLPHSYVIENVDDTAALSDLIEGGHDLHFQCKQCGRRHRFDLQALIRTHGPATTLRYIRRSFRCSCE